MTDVKRFDRFDLPGDIKRTDEGFIQADPIVTRTGVFSYRMPDGTVRKEFRSDEEVFAEESLTTVKMIPITNTHPKDWVAPGNVGELGIGMTGENARRDGDNLRVPIKITKDEGIEAIEGGRLQLSLGYKCLVERKDGEWNGEAYTHVQRRIRYNHLALCDKARAGAQATLRLDAGDAVMVESGHDESELRKEHKTMDGKVRLDSGVSYDVPPEVEAEFGTLRKERKDAAETLAAEKTAKAELQGKLDGVSKELEELKKVDNADAIAKGVKERVELLAAVKPMLSEEDAKKADDMDDAALRIAAIMTTDKEFKAEGRDEGYIKGRFDAAVSAFAASDKAKREDGKAVIGDGSGHKDDDDPAKAREEMQKRRDGTAKAKDKE